MNERNKQQLSFKTPFLSPNIEAGVFAICLLSLFCSISSAQPVLTITSETGKNNVSQGWYLKPTVLAAYRTGKINIETGFQSALLNGSENMFTGYTLNSSEDISIFRQPLTVKGFYTLTRNSDILRESNLGASLSMRRKHFEMTLGTNLRTFSFSKQAVLDYRIDKSSIKVHEINNYMYSFGYYLKPTDDRWNAGISVTNIDQFVISQETNPFINLQGQYKFHAPVTVFANVCYKVAGFSNLELNHFGYYIKTGLIWKIN